jgi:hypothetical protein
MNPDGYIYGKVLTVFLTFNEQGLVSDALYTAAIVR